MSKIVYTQEKARQLIFDRYKNMSGKYPFTIRRLEKDVAFQKTFQKLKGKGYGDWVIYMAIAGIVNNYRVQKLGIYDSRLMHEHMKKTLDNGEKQDDLEVPSDQFTEEKIEFMISLNLASSLKIYGFEIRRSTPNFNSLRKFLTKKYNYFAEDVEHEKWFGFEKV